MYLQSCLLLLIYNYVEANFTNKWQRVVFFPSAQRVRRSSAEFLDPVLQTSLPEVELLYEPWGSYEVYNLALSRLQLNFTKLRAGNIIGMPIPFLSTGVHIDQDDKLTIRDPELSSLRKATTFDVVCNDVIPKSISDIRRLGDKLSYVPGPLKREDFERTLLTMAYTALKTSKSDNNNQQKVWMETLTKLFIALRRDLMFPYNKEGQQ